MEIKYTVTPTPEGAEVEEITAVGGPGDWIETDVDDVCIGAAGYRSEICANGDSSHVAAAGEESVIKSAGDYVSIACAGRCENVIESSGSCASITSTGDTDVVESRGKNAVVATCGDETRVDSTGGCSVIVCLGNGSGAKAEVGSWITLAEWKLVGHERKPVCVRTEYVDGEKIKPGVYYRLVNGEFTEVDEYDIC